MGIQEILVACLFIAAIIYVGRIIYNNLKPNSACGTNCKCGVDFSKIEIPDSEKK